MSIEFVDNLPGDPHGATASKWERIAEELRANPGTWAVVARCAPNKNQAAFRVTQRTNGRTNGLDVACRTVNGVLTAYMRAPETSNQEK